MAKAIVDSLTDVPEALRGEYEPHGEKFRLKLEGDLPGFVKSDALTAANAKLEEFRTNNRAFKDQVAALEQKIAGAIDPTEHASLKEKLAKLEKDHKSPEDLVAQVNRQVEAAVKPLQKKLEDSEKREAEKTRALAQKELETSLRTVAAELGVDEKAFPDFLRRGLDRFTMEDGKPVAKDGDEVVFSAEDPRSPLSPSEWAKGVMIDAPHLFRLSRGGGADHKGGNGGGGGPKRFIAGGDAMEFGRNLEAIAKGEVGVVPQN